MTFEMAKEKAIARARSGLPGVTVSVPWDGGIVLAARTNDGTILFWPDTPSKVLEPEVIEPPLVRKTKRKAGTEQPKTKTKRPKTPNLWPLLWLAAALAVLAAVWEVVK